MIIGEAFLAVRPEVSSVERIIGGELKKLAMPGGPAAVAGVAIGTAIVGGLFAVGEGFEKAFNRIRAATGATDQEMKGLESSFKKVFASTPGATMTNVADTMSLIHQRTGLAGSALEDFTKKEIELAKITKTDVHENVQITTALFGKFGIAAKDQANSLDVLYKASLVGGKGVSQLASDMTATRGVTASMGLTFNQSAALMAQFEQHGLNATQAMMALNRGMTSLGKDGGPQSQAGLDKLQKAADAADKALARARDSAGRAGAALGDSNAKAKETADKGLTMAEAALARVNARLDEQRNKGLAAHAVWTMTTQDSLALKLAQDKVAEAQAKVASAGGGAGSGAAQRALADATAKAAAAHQALSSAQKGGATSAAEIQTKLHGLFDSIKGAATEQDALNIAAANFGVRGGRELGLAIRSGALDFDTLAKKLGTGGDAIDKTTQKTLTLGDKMQIMKNHALVAIEPLAVKIVDIANLLFDKLPVAWDRVSKFMEPVVNFIQHNAVPALAAVGTIAAAVIIPAIVGLGTAIAAFVAGPLAAMVVAAAPVVAVAAIAFGIVYAFQHVKVFHDLVIKLRDVLVATARFVIDHWKLVAAVFLPFIAMPVLIITHFRQIVSFFEGLPGNIASAISSLGATLIGAFTDGIAALVDNLPSMIGDLVEFFVTLPLVIVETMVKADTWLVETGAKILAGLLAGLVNALPGIGRWFLGLPARILDYLNFVVKVDVWLVETGGKIIVGLFNGLVGMIGTVTDWFGKLPGLIVHVLTSVGGGAIHWLEDVAKDVMKGLANGLVKYAEDTVGKIPIIGGRIVSMFKDALGVKSPSTIFHSIGMNLMQGLANGIDGGAHLPVDKLLGLNLRVPNITGGVGATPAGGSTAMTAIAVQIGELNRHLRDRPQMVVHQNIQPKGSDSATATASESVRLLAAAGYRWGRR